MASRHTGLVMAESPFESQPQATSAPPQPFQVSSKLGGHSSCAQTLPLTAPNAHLPSGGDSTQAMTDCKAGLLRREELVSSYPFHRWGNRDSGSKGAHESTQCRQNLRPDSQAAPECSGHSPTLGAWDVTWISCSSPVTAGRSSK